jgi:MscS family membrane protein
MRCTTRRHRTLAAVLFALALTGSVAWAQGRAQAPTAPATPAVAPAQTEAPKDALGRETPRGTVLGFMSAARRGNDEVSPLYLDTSLKGQAAVELAHKLYVVLDSRLPARLNELSDRPEGVPGNPLKPDQNVVGTINTGSGPFDVVVERVTRGTSAPVWLFSRQTLSFIPDAYGEVDLVALDRFLPDILARPRVFGIRLFEWLALFLLLPLSYRLLGAFNWLARPFVVLRSRRRAAPAGRSNPKVPGAVRLVILGIAIRWVLGIIDLPLLERQFWTAIAALLLVIALGWFLLLLNGYGERYIRQRLDSVGEMASLLRVGRRVADVLVVLACGLATFRYFGFDPTAALAGLGIGGIAIALAAQKTLENVIAGLSLIFDKAVRVGDFMKFGDTVGTVDYIGLRSTRIRTLDRTMLSVPNGQIASVGIETLSARDKYRFYHVIGLRYETSVDQMRAVIDGVRTLLLTDAGVESDSVRVRFFRLGSFSLDVEVAAYVFAADWDRFLAIQQELLLRIMKTIEGAGTGIAFPSQTLHIAGATPSGVPVEAGKRV